MTPGIRSVFIAGLLGASATAAAAQSTATTPVVAGTIVVGAEYVLLDREARVATIARMLGSAGIRGAKHYAEHVEWGEMQKGPLAPIDFHRLDAFVRDMQNSGAEELTICLRSHSTWASVGYSKLKTTNAVPKPQYMDAYARWIGAVVERYDGDGVNDMPGLKHPVRYYEIGSEWSTYEPESPGAYLPMLERAYRAAHGAFPGVRIAHAAFLTTNAFDGHPDPADYERAFAAVDHRVMFHSLGDIRRILDRGDLFDVVNVHSIGDPSEIDAMVDWLRWEMKSRGYSKPIIISDTAPTPFIAWGPATSCTRTAAQMGIVVHPATESDRCRLAQYFTKLVDGDTAVVHWTQGFTASDLVQRVVIAASQGVTLINTAFVEDLVWFKLKVFGAGTGTSAWAGLIDPDRNEQRAGLFALAQVCSHIGRAKSVTRIESGASDVRLYDVQNVDGTHGWVAWLEPSRLVLPGDPVPTRSIRLTTSARAVTVEAVVTRFGQTAPSATTAPVATGAATLNVTPTPIFVSARN